MKFFRQVLTVLLLATSILATGAGNVASDIDAGKSTMSKLFPQDKFVSINKTVVPGLYEVDFGDSFIYITADGKHAVKGDIIDIRRNVNITENRRAEARLDILSKMPKEKMIIYPVKNKRFAITVFTDIDCVYCRKLHNEINLFAEQGIEVRYLFYPRAGVGSASYKKAESVWCADDRLQAMTNAKSGKRFKSVECDNPLADHLQLAKQLNISSTPSIFLDDGTQFPGYAPAARLAQIMEQRRQLALR